MVTKGLKDFSLKLKVFLRTVFITESTSCISYASNTQTHSPLGFGFLLLFRKRILSPIDDVIHCPDNGVDVIGKLIKVESTIRDILHGIEGTKKTCSKRRKRLFTASHFGI